MLRQHLKNDKIWKLLNKWNREFAAHQKARIALQRKTISLIQKKTGLKMTDLYGDAQPYFNSIETGGLFYSTVVKQILGIEQVMDIENHILIDGVGQIKYSLATLAEAPGREQEVQKALKESLRELKASSEILPVKNTYAALNETAIEAHEVIEKYMLLGFIARRCDICKRLGF
jgi:hypothetical protein